MKAESKLGLVLTAETPNGGAASGQDVPERRSHVVNIYSQLAIDSGRDESHRWDCIERMFVCFSLSSRCIVRVSS